jgi:hypothetical protein
MTVFILFLSGNVVFASTSLKEVKQYVLDQINAHDGWSFKGGWHYIGYEILDVYVPTGDEAGEED